MNIEQMLASARQQIDRVEPGQLAAEHAAGALVVDIRPTEQRRADGELVGAVAIDRNVLEWRLDPTSPWKIPEMTGVEERVILVCNEGYASSLAAATLRELGVRRAADLAGGVQELLAQGFDPVTVLRRGS